MNISLYSMSEILLYIIRPMDLLKMEEKLDNGEYYSFNEFRTDFKLIVNNCRLYNGQNNGMIFRIFFKSF